MFSFDCNRASRKIRVSFIHSDIVRIQMSSEEQKFKDSALNRYGFIQEIADDCHVSQEETATGTILKSPAMTIGIDNQGLLNAADASGKQLLSMTALEFGETVARPSFAAMPGEDWIGFGDQTRERLFHRGYTANCWICSVIAYLPVPFFMSTQGYGVLVNSTHEIAFDMCANDANTFSWSDERGVIDFYLFATPSFKACIQLYTQLTGKPKLPPEWAFGLWYICRTQANDTEVISDAMNFRREEIPCDLIGLEPGWMEKDYDYTTEKTWNQERFHLPDWQKKGPYTFIKALKRMGYHLELWLCQDYDLSFEEERRLNGGKLPEVRQRKVVYIKGQEMDPHFAFPVYSDQITRRDEPWFRHLEQFVDWGADFFKQDGSRQICTHPDRLFGNGMTDAEMHNLYPLLYSRQMWEGFAKYTNRRPVVFTVSGWTGFQAWCGTWTGDTGGRLETLGAMLNTAVMGHCWATNDMEVMQKEGIHFGYLQPWSQINSWTYFRMPWVQGNTLLALHKYYSRLRSRLIPYLYSWGRSATLTSVPLMLPLHIEFQDDLNTRSVMHEYLLGRDLLVTIYKDEAYFPEGNWKDFWTGEVIPGGQTRKIAWPEDRGGGLFLREGAIVPFGPVMQYRKERPLDDMELYVFPSRQRSEFELYEDDGVSFEYLEGKFHLTKISQQTEPDRIVITIGPTPEGVTRKWSVTVAMEHTPTAVRNNGKLLAPEQITWDAVRQEARIVDVEPGEIVIQ